MKRLLLAGAVWFGLSVAASGQVPTGASTTPSSLVAPASSPSPAPTGRVRTARAAREAQALPRRGGLSPGTPSPWGIPPEILGRASHGAFWYVQQVVTAASMSFSPVAEARKVAFASTIPLRSDRLALGTRVSIPVGGSPSNGVTGSSFQLARGGSATTSLVYGLAFPLGEGKVVSVDAITYARGGNDLLARSWGATLPYGAFVDHSRVTAYSIPGFSTQLGRVTYLGEGLRHRLRAVVGDYVPVIYSPVEGARERNFIDLGNLTFRPFQANLSILGFGTTYPFDVQFGPSRPAVRGADVYLLSGDIELELLSAHQETHPSEPSDRYQYRASVGGRAAIQKPDWGVGVSAFNMYGDNLRVPTDPTRGIVAGGHEFLWALDGSSKLVGDLSVFGAFASSRFDRNGVAFSKESDAVVAGLVQRGWPGRQGEVRLQYQSIGPNYEDLNVRNQVYMPANYAVWNLSARYPFRGGVLTGSVRQLGQRNPGLVARDAYANADVFFPSNAANQVRGQILDWLVTADVAIPKTPCRLYASWEEVSFDRGATPGLANSATRRSVGQQTAMLRIEASPQVMVDVGVVHFQSGGTLGAFNRDVLLNEKQTVPRVSVTWSAGRDLSAYLAVQRFTHVDGLSISKGLNNYNADTVLLEVQSRWGGRL